MFDQRNYYCMFYTWNRNRMSTYSKTRMRTVIMKRTKKNSKQDREKVQVLFPLRCHPMVGVMTRRSLSFLTRKRDNANDCLALRKNWLLRQIPHCCLRSLALHNQRGSKQWPTSDIITKLESHATCKSAFRNPSVNGSINWVHLKHHNHVIN